MNATIDGKPLFFTKYENIENKNPKFAGQTAMLDGGHYIAVWLVEDKYYACIG